MSVLISVVIATYKRPELLVKCLDCLLLQNFDKNAFEVIVVSDGKDEATELKIEAWKAGSNITLIYNSLENKSGPAAARNFGWKLAKGDLS